MTVSAGPAGPCERNSESVISVSDHYTGGTMLEGVRNYCLIVTDRRVICVNTDALIKARTREAADQRAGRRKSLLQSLLEVVSFDHTTPGFCDHFRQMHPSDIIAAHPGAAVIPLTSLECFAVTKGLVLVAVSETGYDCWETTITGRHNARIVVKTLEYPAGILENEALKTILGNRFHPPSPGLFW